jgi:hypothetical protein
VLARSAREAVAAGAVRSRRGEFATILRAAGDMLRTGGASPDRMYLSRRILDVAHQVDLLRTEPEPKPPATVPPAPVAQVPEPDAEAIVPIESLELAGARPSRSPLEAGLSGYQRRVKEQGLGDASLEALATPSAALPVPDPDPDLVVGIASLCYSGRSALRRAAELRTQIAGRIAEGDMETARPLVQELLDLVPLALDDAQ